MSQTERAIKLHKESSEPKTTKRAFEIVNALFEAIAIALAADRPKEPK